LVRSCNHFWGGKAICITHSESVFVAFGTQHSLRMRRIIFSFGAYPLYNIFHTISKRAQFSKKVIQHKMCGFYFLCNFFLQNLSF